jgi:hypothetical protein
MEEDRKKDQKPVNDDQSQMTGDWDETGHWNPDR